MVNQFTIDGETYIPFNGTLFKLAESISELEGVKTNTMYLYEGNIVQFKEGFDSKYTYFPQNDPDLTRYIDEDPDSRFEEFSIAVELERVVPDNLVECPNCGASAGEKSDEEAPKCFQCGYGTNGGVYEDRLR